MGVIVEIEVGPDQSAYGLLEPNSVSSPEWRVYVNMVPRVAAFSFGDTVIVDGRGANASSSSRRPFLRVAERGSYQPTLRVAHVLEDDDDVDAWLDQLTKWETYDGGDGVVWVSAPEGVDARAVLAGFHWVKDVRPA
jgi:hypothetical protein